MIAQLGLDPRTVDPSRLAPTSKEVPIVQLYLKDTPILLTSLMLQATSHPDCLKIFIDMCREQGLDEVTEEQLAEMQKTLMPPLEGKDYNVVGMGHVAARPNRTLVFYGGSKMYDDLGIDPTHLERFAQIAPRLQMVPTETRGTYQLQY